MGYFICGLIIGALLSFIYTTKLMVETYDVKEKRKESGT